MQYCTGIGRIYRQFVRSHANRWHPDVCPVIDFFDAAGDEQHHVPDREHHPLFEGQAKTGYGRIAFAVIRGEVILVGSFVRAYPRSTASDPVFLSGSPTQSPVKEISAPLSGFRIKNKRFIKNKKNSNP